MDIEIDHFSLAIIILVLIFGIMFALFVIELGII
jgi:hypothetical protein